MARLLGKHPGFSANAGASRLAVTAVEAQAVVDRLRAAGCVSTAEEAAALVAAAPDEGTREAWVRRREAGEPLAWLTGATTFCGRPIRVDPGVYVPRPHSEELARRAAALLAASPARRAVDLCTGAGPVAAHLAAAVAGATVVGVDVDPCAAACARSNGVTALVGDLDQPLAPGRSTSSPQLRPTSPPATSVSSLPTSSATSPGSPSTVAPTGSTWSAGSSPRPRASSGPGAGSSSSWAESRTRRSARRWRLTGSRRRRRGSTETATSGASPSRRPAEGGSSLSRRKAVVEQYFDGFRRSDHVQVLECLTDDVVWDLPGFAHLTGKDAFDRAIENDEFVGSPTLTVDRLIEEADTVVAVGKGETTHKSGERRRFAFCDVFTFVGDAISRVESYLVPLQ